MGKINPENLSLDSQAVHAGEPNPRIEGAVAMPVFQSATYEVSNRTDGYHDLRYLRLSNSPNHIALQSKLAFLEQAESALVAASGMAAISTTLLSVLKAGDHLLAQNCLYGGTYDFLTQDLPQLGIQVSFVDASDVASWAAVKTEKTKAIYVESLTNPLVQVADHDQVIQFAKQHDLITMIDNTLASPVNFKPIPFGYDLSLHSATKYLNGHSDIVAGAVIGNSKLVSKVKHKLDHLGGSLDAHACFLLHRGVKTLGLRVRQQNQNAFALAEMLTHESKVCAVHYAGLETSPDNTRAKKWFNGCGGLFSFELSGGADAAATFIDNVLLPIDAPSLGGVESLITIPATSSHAGMTVEERASAGISDGLVRVAVGIESTDDLIADFKRALSFV